MIKCEVIKKFTLKDFYKLKNIERKSIDLDGHLYVGDRFECNKEMASYLTGNNDFKDVVVKILEVNPEESKIDITEKEFVLREPTIETIEKNVKKKKTTKKKKD